MALVITSDQMFISYYQYTGIDAQQRGMTACLTVYDLRERWTTDITTKEYDETMLQAAYSRLAERAQARRLDFSDVEEILRETFA